MQKDLRRQQALEYHSKGRPGKIEVVPTKEAKHNVTFPWLIHPVWPNPAKKFMQNRKQSTNTLQKETWWQLSAMVQLCWV